MKIVNYQTKIKFLTTTFPKFQGDSHAPWILSIAERLINYGYKVEVITPSSYDLKRFERFGKVEVYRFRYFWKKFEKVAYGANIPSNLAKSNVAKCVFPFFIFGFLFAAFRSLKNTDAVHAQFGYSGLFVSLAHFIKRSKQTFFVSFYGRDVAEAMKYKFLYKLLFRRANLIFVLSEDMKKVLIKSGCPKDKIKVHHLGIDCKSFSNNKKTKIRVKREFLLLVVANFVKKKGIDKVINSLSLINNSSYDIRLKIVGRGPLEDYLKNLVFNLGLDGNVDFINNYLLENPREYVINIMKNADIFILPGDISRDDYGGTPIVLMEAGAMNLPCITTNNAGNNEVVIDKKTGFVLPNQNIKKIAETIDYLVVNHKERIQLGKNARKYIKKNFNINDQIIELISLYEKYINS